MIGTLVSLMHANMQANVHCGLVFTLQLDYPIWLLCSAIYCSALPYEASLLRNNCFYVSMPPGGEMNFWLGLSFRHRIII
jgi:hypothetical protein